jgi:hypothetical protein
MKRLTIFAAVGCLLATFLLSSCDSKQKVSENLRGVWATDPEALHDTGAARTTVTRLIEFTPSESNGEGNITLVAYITVENTVPFNDSIVTPLTITASGTASMSGTYAMKDHDDMDISLNPSTLSVNVDPDAVQLNYDVLSESSSSDVVNLTGASSILASQQIGHIARNIFFHLTEIEDIKVNYNLMKCELDDTDFVFHRQGVTLAEK